MELTGKILKDVIAEAINEYYYGGDEAEGDVVLELSDLIERMPDSEEKSRLLSDMDLADQLLPEMAFEYSIYLVGDRHEDRGDYWTPPNCWVENTRIKSDDNLLSNIQSVKNTVLRNGLLAAYKEFEREVENGDYDDSLE